MTLTLRNDIQDVPLLAAFIDEVCEAAGFNASVAMQMNLAMEEAVVNVMNYAYPVGVKGDIVIEAEDRGDSVQFVIIDGGTPFDPTAKADADTTLSVEERPIGGLGIFLVRQLMDTVSYEYKGEKNRLTLVKNK
jgi:sigma-B regulation protein RsbU (phosphoserine phosphatase)